MPLHDSPAGQLALVVQTIVEVRLHRPVVGQLAFVVQIVVLVRAQTPADAVAAAAPVQSPSQAFPSLSPSAFAWLAFGVRTQLSRLSTTPSPSRSVSWLQAAPRSWLLPAAWSGL